MEELYQAAEELKNGNESAFQPVYEMTRRTALAVIRKYCDNQSDYEDILQETYLKVYQYIFQLEDVTKIQPWINKIAANTAVRHTMKKKPMMFSEMADEEGNVPEFEDESGRFNPEIITGRQALSQIVSEMLSALPDDQRTALWMVYGQKITIREMAENLGISENTIKSRLFQGRKKLLERKSDFRKMGVELTVIPVSLLIAWAFEDTVYAAAGEFVTAGGAAAGMAAGVSSAGRTAAENAASGAANAASGIPAAVTAKAAAAGMSLGMKAGITVAAAAVIAAGGLGVKTAVSHYMENRTSAYEDVQTSQTEAEPDEEGEEALAETVVLEEIEAEAEEQGSVYDNEQNRQAVAAYRDALEHDGAFASGYGETLFSVVDVNQDGIYETYVYVPGEADAYTRSYFMYYTDGLAAESVPWGDFRIIPEDNQFICREIQMGIHTMIYGWDGESLQLTEDVWYYTPETEERQYEMDPEGNRLLEEKMEALVDRAIVPESVPLNEGNLDEYLSGCGKASPILPYEETVYTQEAERPEETAAEENPGAESSFEEEIQFIRETYGYTNSHLQEYATGMGYSGEGNFEISQDRCTSYYHSQGNLVKMVIPAQTEGQVSLEIYHLNPDLGRTAQYPYLDYTAVFLYGWDGEGREYRIYMKDGTVIRYIGPDGLTNDYPEGLALNEFSQSYDGVWSILAEAFPGWWVAYEGEG